MYACYKTHLGFLALLCNYTTVNKVEGLSFMQTGKHIMYNMLHWATEYVDAMVSDLNAVGFASTDFRV